MAVIAGRAGGSSPRTGIILGSGLGGFADAVEEAVAIPYGDLPGFPETGVAGHAGRLILGRIGGAAVAVMQGRAHYYESGAPDAMKVAVRTLGGIGCHTLLVTNAAGSLNPDAGPGSVMLISDHISFTGVSPLFGETGNERFVDLGNAYDSGIRAAFHAVAEAQGIVLHDGVYMWFCGPHFETHAEIRAAAGMGADAVGMSTVPEVIVARHAGLKVGALSLITNAAAGMGDSDLSHDHVMANAAVASQTVSRLLKGFLANSAA
jgi:purine nucleotide phosphorylase